MRARIWGSRGSLASPGPDTVRYGGNTSCIEVRLDDGSLLVLDAGTGIRPLGDRLGEEMPARVDVLLTHLHLDHLAGLAFFAPVWRSDVELHIWGPASATRTLRERIAQYFSPPLFPVHLSEIPSQPRFHDAPAEDWKIGSATIRARMVVHRGPTVGYRLEENRRVLAYLPDHEPALGVDLRTMEPAWISGNAIARDADVLLHDAQYTSEEYATKVGWGHSSVEQVVTFAEVSGVQRLLLFHHDPTHDDAELEGMLTHARDLWKATETGPELAHEGMEIDLGAAG